MFKVNNGMSPQLVKEIFDKRNVFSARLGNIFARPNVNTVYKGENSVRNFGPIVWNNMIPENLKSCSNLFDFKKAIKSWIPENCPCRLCKEFIPDLGFISTC